MTKAIRTTKKQLSNEQLTRKVQRLLKARGKESEELARKNMLNEIEKIQSEKVKNALTYFAKKYWSDMVRPTLMSLACDAAGDGFENNNLIAVAMMLISAGIDIHDDIIDESKEKNGRFTVLGKFGKDLALLVGDALVFKGFIRLLDTLQIVSPEKSGRILKVIEDMFFELGDAEASELPFRGSLEPSPEDYLQILERKAADVEAYTHISAILCNDPENETEALRTYGRKLGMLAIIRDDLIDMKDENELWNRLRKEIAPLPVLYAAQQQQARHQIEAALSRHKSLKQIMRAVNRIARENNGFEKTYSEMEKLFGEGLSSINRLNLYCEGLQLLLQLAKTT
jgi:octaprenyl-diphosphate synthase